VFVPEDYENFINFVHLIDVKRVLHLFTAFWTEICDFARYHCGCYIENV